MPLIFMNDLIIDAELLKQWLDNKKSKLIIVDICQAKTYQQIHLPNAIHINYSDFVTSKKPVNGLLPSKAQLEALLATISWTKDATVVCYDEEGGGMSGRFIWTCHAFGINNISMLNGGINYWYKNNFPCTQKHTQTLATTVSLQYDGKNVCDAQYIMSNLEHIKLMDARSIEEYTGTKNYAARAGKIPGAIHCEWTELMDQSQHLKTQDFAILTKKIESLGFSKTDEIIVYCQTHHRSALNYTVLKQLGFNNVKGYEGSWSDWGNRTDTPIE